MRPHGVRVVGDVPQGLPPLTMPSFSPDLLGS
jgi:SulP family sulfate permease